MSQDLFHWSDDFSIGIKEIDEQHKELVRLLNALNVAIHKHRGSAACRKILDSLADYTKIHFTVEESLMRVSGFPGFEAHRRDHEDLISQVATLQEKLDAGQAKITFELLHFLKQWLLHHIVGDDKRFGGYFLAVGGRPSGSDEFRAAIKGHKPWWKFW